MRFVFICFAGLAGSCLSSTATAGVFADDLSRCLVRSANEDDRQALVRWLFMASSAHPALQGMTNISEADGDAFTRAAAGTFNRLLLRDCRTEAIEAIRNEGEIALQTAFETLGEATGQQMLGSSAGLRHLERVQRHLDLSGIEGLAREAGIGAPDAASPSDGT